MKQKNIGISHYEVSRVDVRDIGDPLLKTILLCNSHSTISDKILLEF